MEQERLSEVTNKIYNKADLLYEFVLKYSNMMQETHDYGTGELLNMIEVHLLTYIDQNPGITVSQLAGLWNRTKGSISQQVKKLTENGYIRKERSESNKKLVLLYTTPNGHMLSTEHMHYDIVDIMNTTQRLLRTCSTEDIDTFYKVLAEYIKLLGE